jgi:hypothetical protein
VKGIVLAAVFVVTTSAPALACYGSPMLTPFGQTSTSTMTVRSGRPCDISFSSFGPVTNTAVEQRPRHGVVVVDGFGRVIYKSRPKFVGDDSFRYARHGLNHLGKPIVARAQIAVKVIP